VHEWHSRKSWALCRASNFPSIQLFIQKGKGKGGGKGALVAFCARCPARRNYLRNYIGDVLVHTYGAR